MGGETIKKGLACIIVIGEKAVAIVKAGEEAKSVTPSIRHASASYPSLSLEVCMGRKSYAVQLLYKDTPELRTPP